MARSVSAGRFVVVKKMLRVEPQTLDLYGWLLSQQETWAGSLTLCCGSMPLFCDGPAAVSICGGTSLSIGITAAEAKSAQRHGGVDFVVNTLDEALRTLKNSIRERRALGVALVSETEPVLTELLERGVVPECTMGYSSLTSVEKSLLQEWYESFSYDFDPDSAREEFALNNWLDARGWERSKAPTNFARGVREWNRLLANVIPKEDEIRHRWLRLAPSYLDSTKDGLHTMWLTPAERGRMTAALGSQEL